MAYRLAAVAAFVCSGLAGEASATTLIAPPYDGKLRLGARHERSGTAIWQFKDWRVTLAEPGAALALTAEGRWAAVRFAEGSPLAERLAVDPNLIFFHSDKTGGFAIVQPRSGAELDRYAREAHDAAGGACGMVELLPLGATLAAEAILTEPVYRTRAVLDAVKALVDQPKVERIKSAVATLEALGTRFHASDKKDAATATVKQLFTEAAGDLAGFTVTEFDHDPEVTEQKSVIARLEGRDASAPIVILGAHLDSISRPTTAAPGADDDATGIATLTEVLRVIRESGARFERTIEFHGYAAEEIGLVGSRGIALSYQEDGRKVAAMLQVDMNGYSAKSPDLTIHLVDHDTSVDLRRSLKDLLTGYLGGQFAEGTLPHGASSDHKSWSDSGFPAVFPFENPAAYNEAIHTVGDTSAAINDWPLSERFVKLALVFLGHHAGLVAARDDYATKNAAFVKEAPADLKLAIVPSESEGLYHLAVGAPASVRRVEVCRIASKEAAGCQSERTIIALDGSKAGRSVLINAENDPLTLAAGEAWRIAGYDENDVLVGERQVRLGAK